MPTRLRGTFASSATMPSGSVVPLDKSSIPFISSAQARSDRVSTSGLSFQVPSASPETTHILPVLEMLQSGTSNPSSDFSAPSTPTTLQIEDAEYDVLALVPEPITEAWASRYDGRMSGSLPGPGGPARFYKSPTPPHKRRTTRACDFCRHRKMKAGF